MSRTIRPAWLLALPLVALAGCAHVDVRDTRSDSAVLRAQADAWDAAIVRKDRAAIEANMADDFRQIDRRGDVSAKAEFVTDLLDPKLTIDPYTVEDFEVRLYGDAALLTGSTRMSGHYDGKEFRTHYRYTDTYVRRDGRWRIVQVQITGLAD